MTTTIIGVDAFDIRFPTSRGRHGSDAMHPDPDYSAAYVFLRTDRADGIEGHGLTFTIGRGNELCVAAVRALAPLVTGSTLKIITINPLKVFYLLLIVQHHCPARQIVHALLNVDCPAGDRLIFRRRGI